MRGIHIWKICNFNGKFKKFGLSYQFAAITRFLCGIRWGCQVCLHSYQYSTNYLLFVYNMLLVICLYLSAQCQLSMKMFIRMTNLQIWNLQREGTVLVSNFLIKTWNLKRKLFFYTTVTEIWRLIMLSFFLWIGIWHET